MRIGKAGEGQAAWAAWAGPAAVPRLVFSVFSIDSLVFMELLNHRFEKGTAHRGYKMQAEKGGWRPQKNPCKDPVKAVLPPKKRFCKSENSLAGRRVWLREMRNAGTNWRKGWDGQPKRNWRSALHDASRSPGATDAPAGLGVRARQRRFPCSDEIEGLALPKRPSWGSQPIGPLE